MPRRAIFLRMVDLPVARLLRRAPSHRLQESDLQAALAILSQIGICRVDLVAVDQSYFIARSRKRKTELRRCRWTLPVGGRRLVWTTKKHARAAHPRQALAAWRSGYNLLLSSQPRRQAQSPHGSRHEDLAWGSGAGSGLGAPGNRDTRMGSSSLSLLFARGDNYAGTGGYPQEDFLDTLDAFRLEVDNSQIVLDKDVVEALRKIDEFFYLIYEGEGMTTSRYKAEIERLLEKLEASVTSTLSKRHHRISLKLRT